MTDMIPRITVREHKDVHMLMSLLRDAVEHLHRVPGVWERRSQAISMLEALEEVHDRILSDEEVAEGNMLQDLIEFFAEKGITVRREGDHENL